MRIWLEAEMAESMIGSLTSFSFLGTMAKQKSPRFGVKAPIVISGLFAGGYCLLHGLGFRGKYDFGAPAMPIWDVVKLFFKMWGALFLVVYILQVLGVKMTLKSVERR